MYCLYCCTLHECLACVVSSTIRGLLLLLLLRRFNFHFLISAFSLLLLPFCFFVMFRRYFVCAYSYLDSGTVMYEVRIDVLSLLLYPT